jgi:hypothetical protein
LYKRMFFAPKPAPAAGPVARNGAVAAPPGQQPLSQPLSPEAIAAALKAEQVAYLRRLEVCGKLQQIALDRNDEALLRQVEELERQADAVYKQRTAALGLSRTVRAPLPNSDNAFAGSFEIAPEKPVDPKVAATRLVAPAAPVPVTGTASSAPGLGTAGSALPPSQQVREVQP